MSKVVSEKEAINEFLNSRYIEAVFPSKEKVAGMLMSGKRLVFYLGIDPTGPDLHLGHTTNLLVLKKLTGLGHKAILLIGDFTAQTGDPTDKEATRKVLSAEEVKANAKTYIKQASRILPKGTFDIKYNSKWLDKLTFSDIRKLARLITVQQMIARDMFQKRLSEGKPITIEEFLYPLMQGYDSVAMAVDGEVGGTDQTFNMMVGRDLVGSILVKDKIVITTKLLEDPITGKKLMNKSEGHYISLQDQSKDFFGKVMAMPDSSTIPLFAYTTEVSDEKNEEVKKRLAEGENPKILKEELAFELTKMYHGEKNALKAKEEFKHTFSQHQLPEDMEEVKVDFEKENIVELIFKAGLLASKGEIKRLIEQKAVKIDQKVVESWSEAVEIPPDGIVLKIGPHRFYKIVRR